MPATADNSSQPTSSIPAATAEASFSNAHTDQGSATQHEQPSASAAAVGGETASLPSSQAAASQAADAAAAGNTEPANADKQKPDADKPAAAPPPAASGWDTDLLASNQGAAVKAAEAKAAAAGKPASGGWGADLLAGNQADAAKAAEAAAEAAKQQPDATATVASAAAPASAPFKFGVPPGAQVAFGSGQQPLEANKTAASGPIVSGSFMFGVPPAAALPQASSPPMAIPAAKDAVASQDANGSLVRTLTWMNTACAALQQTLSQCNVVCSKVNTHKTGGFTTMAGL